MAIFRVNTEAVDNTIGVFNSIASDISSQIDRLTATASGLEAEWTGAAHASFAGHLETWRSFANTVHTQLTAFSQATNAANQLYVSTEEHNISGLR